MAVLPHWHGHTVAEQMLRVVQTELLNKKCLRISLDTTEPLRRAIPVYERNGFRASGKVVDFFGMPLYEYVKALQAES